MFKRYGLSTSYYGWSEGKVSPILPQNAGKGFGTGLETCLTDSLILPPTPLGLKWSDCGRPSWRSKGRGPPRE
jgi:hypothetical protein